MNIQDLILNTLTRVDEKILTMGDRSVAFPKYGQIIILAGGAGSGKGFASEKVLNISGKRFDVDELKSKMLKGKSPIISKKFLDLYGRDIRSLDLKNAEDVSLLHTFVEKMGYDQKVIQNFIKGETRTDKDTSVSGLKQNIIFDVTLKKIKKLETIYKYASEAGYNKRDIHIVWILNDMQVAMANNAGRERVVAKEILIDTHTGASATMHDIIKADTNVQQWMDGDIWVLFNNRKQHDLGWEENAQGHGRVTKYTALQLKKQGQKPYSESEIEGDLLQKLRSYVPINPETGKKSW